MDHKEELTKAITEAQDALKEIGKPATVEATIGVCTITMSGILAVSMMSICQEISELTDAVQRVEEAILSLDTPAKKEGKKRAR